LNKTEVVDFTSFVCIEMNNVLKVF
jgi:hypothetical protein